MHTVETMTLLVLRFTSIDGKSLNATTSDLGITKPASILDIIDFPKSGRKIRFVIEEARKENGEVVRWSYEGTNWQTRDKYTLVIIKA